MNRQLILLKFIAKYICLGLLILSSSLRCSPFNEKGRIYVKEDGYSIKLPTSWNKGYSDVPNSKTWGNPPTMMTIRVMEMPGKVNPQELGEYYAQKELHNNPYFHLTGDSLYFIDGHEARRIEMRQYNDFSDDSVFIVYVCYNDLNLFQLRIQTSGRGLENHKDTIESILQSIEFLK